MAESQLPSIWAIKIFITTVDAGSISAAAARLGSSISAVSQQLSNLESALGCALLDRKKRPIKPTPAGQVFLRRALVILGELDQAKRELAEFDHSKMVHLRLGVIDDFDADVTPRLMTALSKRLGECRFLLQSGASYDLTDELQRQTLDVVIAADFDNVEDWMELYPLLIEPMVVAVPKGRIDQSRDIMAQLMAFPYIRHSPREMMGRQIDAHLTRNRISLSNQFELNNYHAILSLVAEGRGWTITNPMGCLRAQRFMDQLTLMPLPFGGMTRTISLIARAGVLDWIPAEMAQLIRPILTQHMIDPLVTYMPWLDQKLRLIE